MTLERSDTIREVGSLGFRSDGLQSVRNERHQDSATSLGLGDWVVEIGDRDRENRYGFNGDVVSLRWQVFIQRSCQRRIWICASEAV